MRAPSTSLATVPASAQLTTAAEELADVRRQLLGRAKTKTRPIPAEFLVDHLLAMTRDAGWPVQLAALEATLRRWEFARRDALRITSRPRGRSSLGWYGTSRRAAARPYRTLLRSLQPFQGSCDCPDYLRNSLGLCKHLLAVLADLSRKPRLWKRGLGEGDLHAGASFLSWHPVRPLGGAGDPLRQIRWQSAGGGRPPAAVQRWFLVKGRGPWALKDDFAADPAQRLKLVAALAALAGGDPASDPAARAFLLQEQRRLQERLETRAATSAALHALRSLKRPLYPYQKEGVERFLAAERLLLADDMGLGKTVQAIAACHALWETGKVRRGLLVVPASLKFQWLQEWQESSAAPLAIVDGSAAERAAVYRRTRSGFLIANYEQVLRDLEVMMSWKPDMMVLDEAQRIKNWATKTALYVKQFRPRYRLVLTGTPMENRVEELASLMDWVDDFALEPKWRLTPWHLPPDSRGGESGGARGLDTLRLRLQPGMLRRVRAEVLRQLPPRTDTAVPVAITAAQLEEHDALKRPIRSLMDLAKKRPLTQAQFLRLMQLLTAQRIIANGLVQYRFDETWPELSQVSRPDAALLQGLDSPKLLEFQEILRQLAVEQRRKVVVFSQWRRMLLLCHWTAGSVLEPPGLRSVFFTGKESPRTRTRSIVDFHDDPDTRVFFATDAGGVGLNLQRAASACVNLDLPWNPAVLEQRIGRIYRLGQKRPIDVYNLIAQGCIEQRIAAVVADKRALFKGLFDGGTDEVRFERAGGFLGRVEKLVGAEPPGAGAARRAAEEEALDLEGDAGGEAAAALIADAVPERGEAPRAAGGGGASAVASLFSRLEIRRRKDGGMTIQAEPAAAKELAALFAGLAQLLNQAGGAER